MIQWWFEIFEYLINRARIRNIKIICVGRRHRSKTLKYCLLFNFHVNFNIYYQYYHFVTVSTLLSSRRIYRNYYQAFFFFYSQAILTFILHESDEPDKPGGRSCLENWLRRFLFKAERSTPQIRFRLRFYTNNFVPVIIFSPPQKSAILSEYLIFKRFSVLRHTWLTPFHRDIATKGQRE